MDRFGFDKVAHLKANASSHTTSTADNAHNNNNSKKEHSEPVYFAIYEDPEPVQSSGKKPSRRTSVEPLIKRTPLATLTYDQVKLRSCKLSATSPQKSPSKSPSPRASISMSASDLANDNDNTENGFEPVANVSSISKRLKLSIEDDGDLITGNTGNIGNIGTGKGKGKGKEKEISKEN